MSWRIIIKQNAEKNLQKIPAEYRQKVYRALFAIGKDPFSGKKLQGEYEGYHGARVWPYRIIYKIYPHMSLIDIVYIRHRQGAY